MYRIPFMVLLSSLVFCTRAQTKIIIHENTTQHDKDNKSSTAKVNKGRVKDGSTGFWESGESAIKLNISPIFRGDYCLSFEKKVTPLLSAELTGGITYSDQLFEGVGSFIGYRPYNMTEFRRRRQLGPSLKAGMRCYFDADEEEIAGPYLGTEAMFRRYNTTVSAAYTTLPVKEYNDHRELRAFFGWQGSDWSDVAFYDISAGIGYRMHVRNYVGYTDNYPDDALMHGQRSYLVFLINFKIGFPLY